MDKNKISPFAAAVLKMSPRELENGDWRIVHSTLVEAKHKFNEYGFGNQSWLDGAIGISQERALTKAAEKCDEAITTEVFETTIGDKNV